MKRRAARLARVGEINVHIGAPALSASLSSRRNNDLSGIPSPFLVRGAFCRSYVNRRMPRLPADFLFLFAPKIVMTGSKKWHTGQTLEERPRPRPPKPGRKSAAAIRPTRRRKQRTHFQRIRQWGYREENMTRSDSWTRRRRSWFLTGEDSRSPPAIY